MAARHRLTRALVLLILTAAILSAPVFLLAEGFEKENLARVVLSNGSCALLCGGLLALLRRGRVELAARSLVFGLLGLVGWLAWTNGEAVHVNVINFVLVTLLAAVLLGRAPLVAVGTLAALEMIGIAWKQAPGASAEALAEARVESIAQFLPTFVVVVVVLWLRERPGEGESRAGRGD